MRGKGRCHRQEHDTEEGLGGNAMTPKKSLGVSTDTGPEVE